jgi:hypothetical protein
MLQFFSLLLSALLAFTDTILCAGRSQVNSLCRVNFSLHQKPLRVLPLFPTPTHIHNAFLIINDPCRRGFGFASLLSLCLDPDSGRQWGQHARFECH